jgi:hypothetical protein
MRIALEHTRPNYALQRTGNYKVPRSWRRQAAAERGR